MALITVDFSESQLADVQSLLRDVKNGAAKALSGAINDTVKQEKTAFSREVRKRINLKKADVDKYITVARATVSRISGIRLSESHRPGLGKFGARQISKGVSYKVLVGGARKTIPHAFGPDIPRLGKEVWTRTGEFRVPSKGRYAGKVYKTGPKKGQRVVREVIAGPKRAASPWGVFVKANIMDPVQKEAEENLVKNLNQRIKYLLLKQSGAIA